MAKLIAMDTMKAINITRIYVDMALPNVKGTMKAIINLTRIQIEMALPNARDIMKAIDIARI